MNHLKLCSKLFRYLENLLCYLKTWVQFFFFFITDFDRGTGSLSFIKVLMLDLRGAMIITLTDVATSGLSIFLWASSIWLYLRVFLKFDGFLCENMPFFWVLVLMLAFTGMWFTNFPFSIVCFSYIVFCQLYRLLCRNHFLYHIRLHRTLLIWYIRCVCFNL